jgi:hypothetical protein
MHVFFVCLFVCLCVCVCVCVCVLQYVPVVECTDASLWSLTQIVVAFGVSADESGRAQCRRHSRSSDPHRARVPWLRRAAGIQAYAAVAIARAVPHRGMRVVCISVALVPCVGEEA